MSEPFTLTIRYKGSDRDFTGQLLLQGYSYKIKLTVGETDVFFEPDEEGGYRVVAGPGQDIAALEKVDKYLLSLLRDKIQAILQ